MKRILLLVLPWAVVVSSGLPDGCSIDPGINAWCFKKPLVDIEYEGHRVYPFRCSGEENVSPCEAMFNDMVDAFNDARQFRKSVKSQLEL